MAKKTLPLKEVSINEIYIGGEQSTYEIPIYQRNYAWDKEEITTLIRDVWDSYLKNKNKVYYIGTLVSYHKGDRVFEIIDGQQRLTTIRLILGAMNIVPVNKLTYRARKKSDDTLKAIPDFEVDEKDLGIENGYRFAKEAIEDLVDKNKINEFINYFCNMVHIIHYQVPKDIDLNHYFEIMNSRGEQLEKHEIVKANLMERLDTDEERRLFNRIWEGCSELSVYIQQVLSGIKTEVVFGNSLSEFIPNCFDEILASVKDRNKEAADNGTISIADIINPKKKGVSWVTLEEDSDKKDSFQPIIDFPNFLLIVLKFTRLSDASFDPTSFYLDDKELISEFDKANMNCDEVKKYAYNLLKARFLLDNYVVHHSKEEDTLESNPWKLQVWTKDLNSKKGQLKNLCEDKNVQARLVHLLSMFEVSFTARQRKNYLFYCLMYLMQSEDRNVDSYTSFVDVLARKYFHKVYLEGSKLNSINTPTPGSFDEEMLLGNKINNRYYTIHDEKRFVEIYGDGQEASRGVPLFVFNYLDYKLWELYDEQLRGEKFKEGQKERQEFFAKLGCSDFGQKMFDQFYFSRTRRSLEHYYPQAMATGEGEFLDQNQINCLGNYAMIGSEANSTGSNWSPKTKLDHYLDSSKKISPISVASLKFMVMMQMCRDNQKWDYDDIYKHQCKMLSILMK